MTMKMTERDKKLLALLGVIGVAALLVFLVIMPLREANRLMKTQIETNQEQITIMEQKLSELPAARTGNEERRTKLSELQEDMYPILKSQDIDRLLTERVTMYQLSARKLQIKLPETAANVTAFGPVKDDGSNPDGKDAVWLAEVSMSVSGSRPQLDGFVDNLEQNMPGIRILDLSWGTERTNGAADGVVNTLSLSLQVIMSTEE